MSVCLCLGVTLFVSVAVFVGVSDCLSPCGSGCYTKCGFVSGCLYSFMGVYVYMSVRPMSLPEELIFIEE